MIEGCGFEGNLCPGDTPRAPFKGPIAMSRIRMVLENNLRGEKSCPLELAGNPNKAFDEVYSGGQ